MSELLNSGKVGIGEKTEEETLKVWDDFGFLQGLLKNEKLKIALLYEKVAQILLNVRNVYSYNSDIDVVIFAITRRVATEIKNFSYSSERTEAMFQLLTAEFITKRVSEIYPDALSFYEKHFSKTLNDVEAECAAWVSSIIANEYVTSFSKKDIINLGGGKYEVVTKVK